MQDSGWRQSLALHVDKTARIIRSIAMYSPLEALEAEKELETELEYLKGRLSLRLVAHIEAVLEDKDLNLEDEDSSIDMHMLRRLKRDAEALSH